MKKIHLIGLSILSGLLLFAAWPVSPLTVCIFFAWTPLLWISSQPVKRNQFFAYTLLATLVWNTGTTWWIWNSTDIGTIAAIIVNSLLMCIPWWAYHIFRKKYRKKTAYAALIVFWMTFEYVHLTWQLSWPWLTLGNVFASHTDWVQWYELTGVSGGTLWILTANIVLFEWLISFKSNTQKKWLYACIGIISLPLFFSVWIKNMAKPVLTENAKTNVVIVQPDIDPYEKFDVDHIESDMIRLVRLSESAIDTSTKLVLWPETAMSAHDWQDSITSNEFYRPVFDFSKRHPSITLLSGVETKKWYGKEKQTATASRTNDGNYYDDFNAAVIIRNGQALSFYNKSKLVPGVESLPTFLNFLAPVLEKFGGTTGGYGRSEASKVFSNEGNPYVSAPVICYESIYGAYVSSYVYKGANLLTIITNDGWWGNTPGHKQHLQYARLRAIETRRWVARSANTGISAVIDPLGDIMETQPWDKPAVIKYNIPVTSGITWYVRFGDYLYKMMAALAILLTVWHTSSRLRKKNRS